MKIDEENKAFLKKKICLKFNKIFSKIFKNLEKENQQKLVLFFENHARKLDPKMGRKYKSSIKEIFSKIKVFIL
jgi:hypothetical protein